MKRPKQRLLFALGLALLASVARADLTVYTDRFLSEYPVGSLAFVVDRVSASAAFKRVRIMNSLEPTTADRRKQCFVAIAHLDEEQVGRQTFVGVQLIRAFTRHSTPGLVHVGRNAGWLSVRDKKPLPELRGAELVKMPIEDFAAVHGDEDELAQKPLLLGARKSIEWHAAATPGDLESYSGTEDHARFWAKNPLDEPTFRRFAEQEGSEAKDIRIENRLMRFQLTDSRSSKKMPKVQFDCMDPSLLFVAVRIYRPFSTDPEGWGFLSFK